MRKNLLILIILGAVFFLLYSYFFWSAEARENPKFNWPDETANFFFAKSLAEGYGSRVFEPLNATAQNLIHPRSVNVFYGYLVPGGFLGLILLYGFLAKIFSSGLLVFFTPFFAIIAVIVFYFLLAKVFSQRVALFSAILLFVHPAFWYYSSFTMLPNIAFVCFLLLGFWLLFTKPPWQYLAGLFLGLGLSMRLAEAPWILIILILLAIFYRKNITWRVVFWLIITMAIVLLPTFYYQQLLYGQPWLSGYGTADGQVMDVSAGSGSWLLPFGLNWQLILQNFWQYGIKLFWWWSLLVFCGFVFFLLSAKTKAQKFYCAILIIVTIWLGIYYGSWQFSDQAMVAVNTLGLSYIRYWLPIYILSIPLIGFLLWQIRQAASPLKKMAVILIFVVCLLFSGRLVWLDLPESLPKIQQHIQDGRETLKAAQQLLPQQAVIITTRTDKYFFPEYKVIHSFQPSQDQQLLGVAPRLINSTPLFYYSRVPDDEDAGIQFAATLQKYNLKIEAVGQIEKGKLYRLEKL